MKKGISLVISCLIFSLMSISVVSATESVTPDSLSVSGNSVSDGNSVSGGDIPSAGNVKDYLFRYEFDPNTLAFIGDVGTKYLILQSDLPIKDTVSFSLALTPNLDTLHSQGDNDPIWSMSFPKTLEGVQGVISSQELWDFSLPIDNAKNTLQRVVMFDTYVSGALFVAKVNDSQFEFCGFFDRSDLTVYTTDIGGKEINISAETLSKLDNNVKIRVRYYVGDNYRKYDPYGSKAQRIRILDADGKKVSLKSVSGYEGSEDFTITKNGTYTIEVSTINGIATITHTVSGIVHESGSGSGDEDDHEGSSFTSDDTAPVITFGNLPSSAYIGSSVDVTIYTDEPAKINFNGRTSSGYVTEFVASIPDNGTYTCIASDSSGNSSSAKLDVNIFTNTNVYDDVSRDDQWGTATESKLPQTGTIGLGLVFMLCGCGVGIGVYLIGRRKKSSDKDGGSEDE